jgi:UDP-N-acetylmuramate: L-alanyl-gamma-D-glutamyl-meso-diaminopimelate ligase
MSERVHFIAIGGAVMHQLAIALKRQGNLVTGSDDRIMDPAKSNLQDHGLLPVEGWDANRITSDMDYIVLGMHAKDDNPELLKAQELGLRVVSFPEMVAEKCANKTRIVVGGSHGKTTTTGMIMHMLRENNLHFDYMVGSKLDSFDYMVEFSDAPIVILEGDEYLSSCLDRVPKFHWYNPHYAILTGVSYDHINVFPTEEIYEEQFKIFVDKMGEESQLIYFQGDPVLRNIADNAQCKTTEYTALDHVVEDGTTYLTLTDTKLPLKVFGNHMLENLSATMKLGKMLGIEMNDILSSLQSFSGTARRMEVIYKTETELVMRDFAHSPSKVEATVEAVKGQFPDRNVIAFFELHTFSSVQKDFLPRYKKTMRKADKALVYADEVVFNSKGRQLPSPDDVKRSFENVDVLYSEKELRESLSQIKMDNTVLLMMSSGTFSNLPILEILNLRP